MIREVPYCENEQCDLCSVKGAYDFQGDLICADCYNEMVYDPEIEDE